MAEGTLAAYVMSSIPETTECLVTSSSSEGPSAKKPKLLPSCRVCGDKSSGLHYGVNTCEACKGFFRRSHHRGENFQCAYNDNCEIMAHRRSNCPACRHKKCLAVGMSKDAIKIGRYTHEKRTQDIREVKNLPQTEGFRNPAQAGNAEWTKKQQSYIISPFVHTPQHEAIDSATCQMSSAHEQKMIFSMSVVDEMQKYVQRLSEAMVHMKYFFAAKPPERLNRLIQNRLDESQLETELLGDDVMPNKEYVKVMAVTGLDLDQRKELVQHWAEGIEETFIVVAQFVKCTPGFKNLPLPDQITLIKATRSQLLFAASHKRFDVKHRCFIGRFNRVESYQDMVKVYNNREFVDRMIELAGKLAKTRLTDIELLLVLALIMTYPDEHVYSKLSNQAKGQLKVMHSQELRVLDFYMKLNHPEKPELGATVHSILQEMREVNKIHDVLVKELQEVWSDFFIFPPLFSEIMQIDFKQRVIPRLTPKVSPVVEPLPVPLSSNHKQHWKKCKIAEILQSSECFHKLMSAATARSRDENMLPKTEQLDTLELTSSGDEMAGLPMSLLAHSNSLSSKLNSCYGISFGDPLAPLTSDVEPLSKCLDQPFTPCSATHASDIGWTTRVVDGAESLVSHQTQLMSPITDPVFSRPRADTLRPGLYAYHSPHQIYSMQPIRAARPWPVGKGKDDSIFSMNDLTSDVNQPDVPKSSTD